LAAELLRVRHASTSLASAVLCALGEESGGVEDFERLQGAFRFAFKLHQFSGGFDADTERQFKQCAQRLLALTQARAEVGQDGAN
jgi:hypothetical protein